MQPNEPEETVKAALYIRSLPGDPANTLPRQLDALRRHVRANRLEAARVHFETVGSNNSQFEAMSAEGLHEDPPFRQILVVEYARFPLFGEELLSWMARLEENGVGVVSISEPAGEPSP